MSKTFTVQFYYANGISKLTEVEAKDADELAKLYQKAFNNKKDRTFTWQSSKMTTVINLDNIALISIQEES